MSAAFEGGAWSPIGVIVFAAGGRLLQVPAAGGTPVPLTTNAPGEFHSSPTFLPDGRRFLYLRASEERERFGAGVHVGSLDVAPERQESGRLLTVDSKVSYVALVKSSAGYLLFDRDERVMAQAFDAERLETRGDAVPLSESVAELAYSASPTGVLVFRSTGAAEHSSLLWFDANGSPLGQVGPPGRYEALSIAPDGTMLAIAQTDPQTRQVHVWTVDVRRGVFSRLNPGSAFDTAPKIARDGRIAFTGGATRRQGDIFVRLANGAAEPDLLVESGTIKHPNDWSPDGRFLVYDEHHPKNAADLWLVPTSGDRRPIPLMTTPADEALATFSPDGKWIAYTSNESGRPEIYVRDFAPDRVPAIGSGKWQISIAGGDVARWSHDGKQINYIASDRKLMRVPIQTTPRFEPGQPVPLFETNARGMFTYDVAPDGRFVINTRPNLATLPSPPITVVLNWLDELRQRLPTP